MVDEIGKEGRRGGREGLNGEKLCVLYLGILVFILLIGGRGVKF